MLPPPRPEHIGDSPSRRATRASQPRTASPSPARSPVSACVPGWATISRPAAGGGMPNGSLSPWITSTGTVTASSSSSRVFSGFPGGWTGKARQSTPAAYVTAAVRQATRAPAERPPVIRGSPANTSPRR